MLTPRVSADDAAALGGEDALRNLLLALCRTGTSPKVAPLRRVLGSREDRLEALLDLAGRHHVTGLVVDALAKEPLDEAGRLAKKVEHLRQTLTRRSAALWTLHLGALEALTRAGLRPVVLKGGAASGFYASPYQREMVDLDVLLPQEAVPEAEGALADLGYEFPFDATARRRYLEHHFHLPVRRGAHYVELHWRLIHADFPFQISADLCLDRRWCSPFPLLPEASMPSRDILVLHLILQNVQEGFARLSRLVDLDRVIKGDGPFPWARLVALARESGLSHAAFLALSLASAWLDTPVPQDLLDEIRPSWLSRRHLSLLLPELFRPSPLGKTAPETRLLLTLWLLPDPVLRVSHALAVLRGNTAEDRFRANRPGPTSRFLLGVRALAHQLRLYRLPFSGRRPGGSSKAGSSRARP